MRMMRRIEKGVAFDPHHLEWLDAESKRRRIRRSDLIEEMINERRGMAEGDDLVAMLVEQLRTLLVANDRMEKRMNAMDQHLRMIRATIGNRMKLDFDGTDPAQLGLEKFMTRTRNTAEALKHEPEHSNQG